MMFKWRITAVALLFVSSFGHGQTESDALNFTRSDINGTARYMSLGGAFTALGGDASGALRNPAGLGVYRDNEFSISPMYAERFSIGNYYGNSTTSGKGNFTIGSFSLTGVQHLNQAGRWRNTAVSFGINRVYSFHENYSINAQNVNSSLVDDYTNIINGLDVNWYELQEKYPFDLYLLWQNVLLETYPGETNRYYNTTGVLPVDQSYDVTVSGAKRETYLNFGSNYDDKLYLGAGVQLSTTSFEKTTIYSEYYNQADTLTELDEFSQGNYDEFDGRGYSATIGAIYRPTDHIRIGFTFKSPEIQNFTYVFESDNITVANDTAYEVKSPYILEYRFRINSPLQTTLGFAYTFKKFGLISLEADYIDYRMISMRGRSDSDPFTNENTAINSLLRPAINVRTGVEYRITSYISARAGYAIYGNPYRSKVDKNGSFQVYSLGGGYRTDQYFFDLAYQYKTSADRFFLYDPNLVEAAKINSIDHRIALTFGLKI